MSAACMQSKMVLSSPGRYNGPAAAQGVPVAANPACGIEQGKPMEHIRRVPLARQWMLEVWQAEFTWYWYARVVNDEGVGLLTLGPYAAAAEAAGAVMMDLSKHKYGYL